MAAVHPGQVREICRGKLVLSLWDILSCSLFASVWTVSFPFFHFFTFQYTPQLSSFPSPPPLRVTLENLANLPASLLLLQFPPLILQRTSLLPSLSPSYNAFLRALLCVRVGGHNPPVQLQWSVCQSSVKSIPKNHWRGGSKVELHFGSLALSVKFCVLCWSTYTSSTPLLFPCVCMLLPVTLSRLKWAEILDKCHLQIEQLKVM